MKITLIDLKREYLLIKEEIDRAINEVIENVSFAGGEILDSFESNFAELCGVKYGIGVSSGSAALDLSLIALGIGKEDEVITTPNTFIATSEAITHTGASIVFADCDKETYNITPDEIEKRITKKTKAIIPVHLFGHPCDMDAIMEIAKKCNLKVIEDCAQAHGALYKGNPVGSFGDCGCFSFYPSKNLGAYGHAGIVVTNNENLATKMRLLSNHGRFTRYDYEVEGYNYRMDTIQAAILGVKLRYLADWNKKRRNHALRYDDLLKQTAVITPITRDYVTPVYHLYVIRIKQRDKLREFLKSNGISTGVHYPMPLHLQPAYKYLGHTRGDFPIAEELTDTVLSIPMFPLLRNEEIDYVVEKIREFYKTSTSSF